MTRPEPVMACESCGPVISGPVTRCPMCDSPEVSWVDLAAGLEHEAAIISEMAELQIEARLLSDAANELRTLRDTIERERDARAGAKRRRQELKANRLAKAVRGPRVQSPADVWSLTDDEWLIALRWVNTLHPDDQHRLGLSDETKALVAAKFAEREEAGR